MALVVVILTILFFLNKSKDGIFLVEKNNFIKKLTNSFTIFYIKAKMKKIIIRLKIKELKSVSQEI